MCFLRTVAFSKSPLLPAGYRTNSGSLRTVCFWQNSVYTKHCDFVAGALGRAQWVWSMSLWKEASLSFPWTISEDWVVALGSCSYFLALITFSTTQPRCTAILLIMHVASITEQKSPRPTASSVQGSSSVFHLSGWPVLFSIILPADFSDLSFRLLSILLAWAGSCLLGSWGSQLPSKQ